MFVNDSGENVSVLVFSSKLMGIKKNLEIKELLRNILIF